MLIKSRKEPKELVIFKILDPRMTFSEKEKQHYHNLLKGYEGELRFDSIIEELDCDCLVLHDLLLEFDGTTFQIDSLVILPNGVYIFEVKNYEGDFYYDANRFFLKQSKMEIKNPLNQLEKSATLMRQLVKSLGLDVNVYGNVIFVNHDFTLYQGPLDKPIIYPTQIGRFMKSLKMSSSSKITRKHVMLAEKLVSLHNPNSPFAKLPAYDYSQLKKGMACQTCHSLLVEVVEGRQGTTCINCGREESLEEVVIRSVEEFRLLFPDRKITTAGVMEWCNLHGDSRRVRRILEKNYKIVGKKKWTHFE